MILKNFFLNLRANLSKSVLTTSQYKNEMKPDRLLSEKLTQALKLRYATYPALPALKETESRAPGAQQSVTFVYGFDCVDSTMDTSKLILASGGHNVAEVRWGEEL